jgi:hypothetical protein
MNKFDYFYQASQIIYCDDLVNICPYIPPIPCTVVQLNVSMLKCGSKVTR